MSKEGLIDLGFMFITDKRFRDMAIKQMMEDQYEFLNAFDISSKEFEGIRRFIKDLPGYIMQIVNRNVQSMTQAATNNIGDLVSSIMSGLGDSGGLGSIFSALAGGGFGGPGGFGGDSDDQDTTDPNATASYGFETTDDDEDDDEDEDEDEDEIVILGYDDDEDDDLDADDE